MRKMGNIITSSPKVNTSSLASSKKEATASSPVITSPMNLSKVGTLTNNINQKNDPSTEIETLDLFLQDEKRLVEEENPNTVDMKQKLTQTDLTEEEIEDLIIEYTETIEIDQVIKDALEAQYEELLYLTGTDYNALYNEYTTAITNSVNEIQEVVREGINSNKEELTEEEQQILTKLNITREQFQNYEYKEEDFTSAVFACSSLVQEEIKTYNEIYNTKIPMNKYDITSFEQYVETMQYLQTNIITLEQSITLREEDIKVLPYLKEMSKEDYQSYVDIKITLSEEELHRALSGNVYEYGTYLTNQGEGQDISPLDFYLQVKEQSNLSYTMSGSKIGGVGNERLDNLIEASQSNSDFSKLYNYYYYTEGLEKANEYLENIQSEVNKTIALKEANEFLSTLPEGCSVDEASERFFKLTGKGLTDGIGQYAQGIFAWLDSSTSKTVLDYESMYIVQALQPKEVKEQMGLITEEGNSCIEEIDFTKDYSGILHISDNVYEIASGIGNMAPSIALGLIGGSIFSSLEKSIISHTFYKIKDNL